MEPTDWIKVEGPMVEALNENEFYQLKNYLLSMYRIINPTGLSQEIEYHIRDGLVYAFVVACVIYKSGGPSLSEFFNESEGTALTENPILAIFGIINSFIMMGIDSLGKQMNTNFPL